MTAAQFRDPAQPDLVRDPTLQRGLDFLHAGRLAEAEFSLTAALAKDPAGFEPLHFLAMLRLQQGRQREALDLVNRALAATLASARSAGAARRTARRRIERDRESRAQPSAAFGQAVLEWRPCRRHLAGLRPARPRRADSTMRSMLPDLARAGRAGRGGSRAAAGGTVCALVSRPCGGAEWRFVKRRRIGCACPDGALARQLRPSLAAFPRREEGFLEADKTRAAALRQRVAGDGRVVVGLSWKSRNNSAIGQSQECAAASISLPCCRRRTAASSTCSMAIRALNARRSLTELGVHVERLGDVDNRATSTGSPH